MPGKDIEPVTKRSLQIAFREETPDNRDFFFETFYDPGFHFPPMAVVPPRVEHRGFQTKHIKISRQHPVPIRVRVRILFR